MKQFTLIFAFLFIFSGCAMMTDYLMSEVRVEIGDYIDRKLQEKFKDADKNKDGFVDKDEAKNIAKEIITDAIKDYGKGNGVDWQSTIELLLLGAGGMFFGQKGASKIASKLGKNENTG